MCSETFQNCERRRVLLCGVERHVEALLSRTLGRLGLELDPASTGAQAIVMACTRRYELAIVAATVADMGPRELVEALKATRDMKVYVLGEPRDSGGPWPGPTCGGPDGVFPKRAAASQLAELLAPAAGPNDGSD